MKLDIETIDEIVGPYREGETISAIKTLRAYTGMGLKEAKDMVMGVGDRKTADQLRLDLMALLPDKLTTIWGEMQRLVAEFDRLVVLAAELADEMGLGAKPTESDRIAKAKTDWRFIRVGDQVMYGGVWCSVVVVEPEDYDGDMPICVNVDGYEHWPTVGVWTDVRGAQ